MVAQKSTTIELANFRIFSSKFSFETTPSPPKDGKSADCHTFSSSFMSSKIPGSRRQLALQIMPNLAAVQNIFNDDVPANCPAAEVGSTPPNFESGSSFRLRAC